jgi:hypothetical protein
MKLGNGFLVHELLLERLAEHEVGEGEGRVHFDCFLTLLD